MKYYSSKSHKLLLDHANELDYEDCLCLIILDPIPNSQISKNRLQVCAKL